jgi:prepilin-type processing-associated H-X9-DG protein
MFILTAIVAFSFAAYRSAGTEPLMSSIVITTAFAALQWASYPNQWNDAPSLADARTAAHRRSLWCFVITMMVTTAVGSMSRDSREPGLRSYCTFHLRNVALALISYDSNRGSLPPAYIADDNAKPMHSWRVLLLPYLERPDLKRAYNSNEPWDGPNNRKLGPAMSDVFCCPRGADRKLMHTNYVALVGPGTAFPIPNAGKLAEIPNLSECILLLEWEPTDIHWMEPRDVTIKEALARFRNSKGNISGHTGGANVAFADGWVRFLDENTLIELLENMLPIDNAQDAKR